MSPMKELEEMESMSATELHIVETEAERVERWRAEALEKVGYDLASALELAARSDVDLHRAIDLVESGCPPELALRILL
jgi:hypothetical protein